MSTPPLIFLYGQAVPRCTHHIAKRFDGYCTLQYMAGGKVSLDIAAEHYALEGRWFWSCYPGPQIEFHAVPKDATWNHHYIAFQGSAVEDWRRDGLYPIAPQRPPHEVDYSYRFDELLALSRRPDGWGLRRARHVLEGILIELAEAREQQAADPLVERAIQLLHDSDYQHDSPQLATELGVSERTLRRRFTSVTGMNPRTYVLHQRVTAAKLLLAETKLPIKQIAQQLAYTDVFYFTRQFTSVAGVSPARYRHSCAG